MKTTLTALAAGMALVCSSAAHSESFFQIEAAIGVGIYTKTGPGIYFDPPFANRTPVVFPAFRAGLSMTPIDAQPRSWIPGMRLHLSYLYFGRIDWDAQAPQDASDFTTKGLSGGYDVGSGTCLSNNCGQMSDFRSYGEIQALAATVEPFWDIGGGWTVGLEVGPAVFRTTWTSDATVESGDGKLGPPGTLHVLSTSPKPHFGVLTGLSISKNRFTLRYNYLFAHVTGGNADNDQVPGVQGAHMISIGYSW